MHPSRPRILCIIDVPNWIFARHVAYLQRYLGDEFDLLTAYRGEAFDENDYDLIYPLEFMLVEPERIRQPQKYVTGVRSFIAWAEMDFLSLTDLLRTRFQRVHVVSRELYNIFAPYIPALEQVSHGVDLELFAPRPPSPGAVAGRLRLGWAGNRATIVKGFAAYIAPLAEIPGVELVYSGFSDHNLSLEQMPEFYAGIDAYISTSSAEGNNNALLEAAAMERAIITTRVGAVNEYLEDGRSAIFIERDLEQIRQAVIDLRDHPEKRRRLGEQARRSLVENGWDWKVKAEEYRRFFRQALAQERDAGSPPQLPGDERHLCAVLARQNRLLQEVHIGDAIRLVDLQMDIDRRQLALDRKQAELEDVRQAFARLEGEIHELRASRSFRLGHLIVGNRLAQALAGVFRRKRG